MVDQESMSDLTERVEGGLFQVEKQDHRRFLPIKTEKSIILLSEFPLF